MNIVMTRLARVAIFGSLPFSLLAAVAVSYAFAGAANILHGEFLSVSEVCQRWGDRPLDIEAFRSAKDDEPARAAMTCSLLKNEADYVGKHWLEIGPFLGDFTGYYYSEVQPTYLIEIAKTKADETWQIVFVTDHDGRVTEIVVHKNCC